MNTIMTLAWQIWVLVATAIGSAVMVYTLGKRVINLLRWNRRRRALANHKRAFPAAHLETPDLDPNELYPAFRPGQLAENDRDREERDMFAQAYERSVDDRYREIRVTPDRSPE